MALRYITTKEIWKGEPIDTGGTHEIQVPVYEDQPIMVERNITEERPVMVEQPILEEKPIIKEVPVMVEKPVFREETTLDEEGVPTTVLVDTGETTQHPTGEVNLVDTGETEMVPTGETELVDSGETEMVETGETEMVDTGETKRVKTGTETQVVDDGPIRHPRSIETKWSTEELAAIGLEVVPPKDKPAPPPPSTDPRDFPLTKVQFQTAIDTFGLRDGIEAAIGSMAVDTEEEKLAWASAKNSFLHANPIHRDNKLFDLFKGSLGLTDEQIDGMWMKAKDF